ncbi:MAG: hypothetical protein QM673_00855 [Gordonia sp. (in: high G+C Gram-positive bacteria)]
MVFGLSEIGPDDLRDDVWVDLLPWLDSYESADAAYLEALVPGVPDWWISDSPRVTAAGVNLGELVTELGRLIVRRHRRTAFGELMPGLDRSIPLASLRLGPRAETVIRRLTARDFVAVLLAADVRTMLALRGTSLESVELIAGAIVGAALRVAPAIGVGSDEETENPVAAQVVDDLRLLARWRRLRAHPDDQLIEVALEDDVPEPVQEAAARLAAVTGRDLDDLVEPNPIDEIENLIEQLDERQEVVLRSYLMSLAPISMGELSSRLHVSKSRAGVIAAGIKNDFASKCGFDTAAGGLLASIRTEIAPVAPLDRLLRQHPVLEQIVPSLGVPLWLVLDRLDDYFEVIGSWAVTPDLASAKARTITMLEQFESENGVVAMDIAAETLGLASEDAVRWLHDCEIRVVAGHVLLDTRRMADHAVGILEALGTSLSIGELVEILDTDKSPTSVLHVLADDERVCMREGRWALAVGASTTEPPNVAKSKDIRRTRRLYRVDGRWCYRMVVSSNHLRGAGVAIPAGVALAFGCRPGTIREIASQLGPQTIRWTGVSPTCGTIRRFLAELGVQPKDVVFLTFSDSSGFDIVPQSPSATRDPLRRALALLGHRAPDDVAESELVGIVASAVGLPSDSKPRNILRIFQSRDEPVAQLLEDKWVFVPQ